MFCFKNSALYEYFINNRRIVHDGIAWPTYNDHAATFDGYGVQIPCSLSPMSGAPCRGIPNTHTSMTDCNAAYRRMRTPWTRPKARTGG